MNAGKSLQGRRLYEFGAFRLNPTERIFARDGERIPLAPKAFDTLLILVQHSDRVLTKEELIQTLWPDSFVEENNLTQHISALRRALGQDPAELEYIETVPKLGYRFACEVREIVEDPSGSLGKDEAEVIVTKRTRTHIVLREEHEEAEEQGDEERSTQANQDLGIIDSQAIPKVSQKHKPILIFAAIGAALLLSVLIYRFEARVEVPATSVATRSIAVLPLRNLKPGADTDFLSMALADAIISRLGYVGNISVEPLSSVAKYKNTDLDARQIARELNVQNVLTGSYVKDGGELQVTMEFISVDKNSDPWRENIELRYDKLFTVQDRVASSIFHLMGVELQPEEIERLNKGAPTNPAAYEYYLRGINEAFEANYAGATKLLEESVALEPGNAMAWNELGTEYLAYSSIQGGDAAYADKGWQAFHRALSLDPTNRFIVDLMAFQLIEHAKVDEATALLRESIKQNPNDSFAHWYLSEAYRYGGALQKSVAEGELALRLNPKVDKNLTFNTYLYVGQYQKFIDTLQNDENNARAVSYRGLAYYYLNNSTKAEEEFDRAFALDPSLAHAQIGRALIYALRRQNDQGLELLHGIEHSAGDDGEMLYKMAQAYAQLGDKQSSLRLLQKSIDLKFFPYNYFVSDPLLQPLHGDADFSALMEVARQRQAAFRPEVQ